MAYLYVTWYLWITAFLIRGSEVWHRKWGESVPTSFLTREKTKIARNFWAGFWLVRFLCICHLFPSGNLFAGRIWVFSLSVQDLWMFSRLSRDTAQLGDSRYVHVVFTTNAQHICRKSDGVLGIITDAFCGANMGFLGNSNVIQKHWG